MPAPAQKKSKKFKSSLDEFKAPTTVEQCDNRIEKLNERIEAKETQKQLKSDTKTVALGTSKINYMDPRVTVAWCKRVDLPLEKVFNASLIQKFPWAMEVSSTWSFDPAKAKAKKEK